jgi:hypothetical protein
MFYESTEKVTERRLLINRWNYSICTAILIAIATMVNWGLSKSSYICISMFGTIIVSVMAISFCDLWAAQISDYKLLNNAKFEVLNEMAPYVYFSESSNDLRISYCPFDKEWKKLKANEAVREIKTNKILNRKIPALSSSKNEYLLPINFKIIYCVIILFACFKLIFSSLEFMNNLFLHLTIF